MSLLKTNAIQTLGGKSILSVLQVVYSDMGSNYADIYAADNAVIPNLSVSITPSSTASKILLIAHIVHNGWYVSSFGFARNGVSIGGNNNTNSSNSIATNYQGHSNATNNSWCLANTYQYLDSPATTSAITYAPTACSSWSGTTYNLRINDRITQAVDSVGRPTGTATGADMRSLSSIVAMEIAQ